MCKQSQNFQEKLNFLLFVQKKSIYFSESLTEQKVFFHFPDRLEMDHTASVTRRSAGLPMLVRSVVSSEKRGSSGGRYLLSMAVTRLLEILERSKTKVFDAETEDVPQCHALHILK